MERMPNVYYYPVLLCPFIAFGPKRIQGKPIRVFGLSCFFSHCMQRTVQSAFSP